MPPLDFGERDPSPLPDQPCRTRTNSTRLPTSTPEQAVSHLCPSASPRSSQGIDTTCLYKAFREQWLNWDRQRLWVATAGADLAQRAPFPGRAREQRVLQRALFTPPCNFCTLHPAVPTKELHPKKIKHGLRCCYRSLDFLTTSTASLQPSICVTPNLLLRLQTTLGGGCRTKVTPHIAGVLSQAAKHCIWFSGCHDGGSFGASHSCRR